MTIELSPEAILSQLGYPSTEQTIRDMEQIIKNTNNFNHFSKHILSLHDNLAHIKGYIAMSNSVKHLKIKRGAELSDESANEFINIIESWAKKYKIRLEKVQNKPTYYILGQ